MRKILRVLVSRYTLSAIFILAELFILSYFIFYAYAYSLIFVLVSAAVDVLVIVSLINRDTNPEFKLTWLAVVTLIPLVGGALYIIFSQRKMTKKEAKLLKDIFSGIKENENQSRDSEYSSKNLASLAEISSVAPGRAVSILKDDYICVLYSNTKCTYYPSGEEFFASLITKLGSAKRYIFLEYFIVEEGEMWQKIYQILSRKVKEGVEVRMLYDDIGSMSTVPAKFASELREEGIMCFRFGKVIPKVTASHNNRDHRKIAVIDGECAFTGGINIADEYINKKEKYGHWKDGSVMVEGDAARGFARLFLMLYDFTVGKVSDYSRFLPILQDKDGHRIERNGTEENSAEINTEEQENKETNTKKQTKMEEDIGEPNGKDGAFLGYVIPFGSGPAPTYKEPVGKNVLMNLIGIAKRYIYITTPYLIIDYDLTEALRGASKRGVDVRIITPHIADKKIIKIMTKSAYPYLLEAGVRIFEYTPGFIHEKLVVSDDTYAVVGTINLDYRSLVHHFEDGLWMYGGEEILKMHKSFLDTETASHEILREDAKLNPIERIVRNLVRIIAPLL